MACVTRGALLRSLLSVAALLGVAACFPDPPPCVGDNPCPEDEVDGEIEEAVDGFGDWVGEADLADDDGGVGDDTIEIDAPADELTDAVEVEPGETEVAPELVESESMSEADAELETEIFIDADTLETSEADLGPELEPKECDDLECELDHRECIEGVGASDAQCGGCLSGYRLANGACVTITTCGDLACALEHRDCIEHTGSSDASCGTCILGYRLMAAACIEVQDCNDVNCDASHRECIEGDPQTDATCGGCVPGYSLVVGDCVADAPAPLGVAATTNRAAEVEIAWDPVPNATGYQVFRCDQATCGGGASGWFALNELPIEELSFVDDTVEVPVSPAAPGNLSASKDSPTTLTLSWSAVIVPAARTYRYRVVAIGPAGASPASVQVVGQVAARTLTGYEVAIDGGAWAPVGNVTTYQDTQAPPPTVSAPTASATQGLHEAYVQLTATGGSVANGATRSYQVRATTSLGEGAIGSTSGYRVAGLLGLQWERSAGTSQGSFAPIAGATGLSFQDSDAPADGATRWYRIVASTNGASSVASDPVAGSRLNPTSIIPTGVSASSNRADEVEVRWSPVGSATGYFIYRCELANCSGSSGWAQLNASAQTSTTYLDRTAQIPASPATPTGVSATTTGSSDVIVTWNPVTVAPAKVYTYRVVAQTNTGPSAPSSHVTGQVADRPVSGYRVSSAGGSDFVAATTSPLQFIDANAPAPAISSPSVTASGETQVAYVELRLTSGGVASNGADRSYQVIAVAGATESAPSSALGRRVSGSASFQWERSSGSTASGFTPIAGGTSASYNDAGAPSDGSLRYYRLVVSADGAQTVTSTSVAGSRLAPPSAAPATMMATTDRTDRIRLTWTGVPRATGYRVLRNGTEIATTAELSYEDLSAPAPASWPAPTVTTSGSADNVRVSWTAPSRPVGVSTTYTIIPRNNAGDGPSRESTGNTLAPALVGYEVEANGTWIPTSSTSTQYTHDAPAGTISATVQISQGDYRAHVKLAVTNAVATQGANVAYRVRAKLDGGTTGLASSPVDGRRTIGSISQQWFRSANAANGSFSLISTALSVDDTNAPADGTHRWYKLAITAPGATQFELVSEGWRVTFAAVDAGGLFTCALTAPGDGGRVWCWGYNSNGQLGLGFPSESTSPPTRIQNLSNVVQLGAGSAHACARKSSGEVACWGAGSLGQLGAGDWSDRSTPTSVNGVVATELSVGTWQTCVVTNAQNVQCWGQNASGQLGNNSDTKSNVPVTVRTSTGGSTLGSAAKVAVEDTGGSGHGCAVTTDGKVWCWGYNGDGGLGTSPLQDRWYAQAVPDLTTVIDVSVSADATCVLLQGGGVRCWGSNDDGQLGNGDTTSTHLPQVPGPPGQPGSQLLSGVVEVVTGDGYACARIASAVKCWGADADGRLGNGASGNSLVPATVSILTATSDLSTGYRHMCAVQQSEPYCWGQNIGWQLGFDSGQLSVQTPTKVPIP